MMSKVTFISLIIGFLSQYGLEKKHVSWIQLIQYGKSSSGRMFMLITISTNQEVSKYHIKSTLYLDGCLPNGCWWFTRTVSPAKGSVGVSMWTDMTGQWKPTPLLLHFRETCFLCVFFEVRWCWNNEIGYYLEILEATPPLKKEKT